MRLVVVQCEHRYEGVGQRAHCRLGLHGGRPSAGTCADCKHIKATPVINFRVAGKLLGGAKSIGKTQLLRIDRVDDDTHAARLAVCDACPEVIRKKGKPHRCGPMYESWKRQGGATCGCLLNLKARDVKQECPQGKWP